MTEARRQYNKEYYKRNKPKMAKEKAWRQKHDLDYRLRAVLATIRHRCESPKFIGYRYYGGKGVKNFLTFDDLKFLWNRDQAGSMRRPSIDRIDNNGHYELSNCCFIELVDNIRRGVQVREANRRKPERAA